MYVQFVLKGNKNRNRNKEIFSCSSNWLDIVTGSTIGPWTSLTIIIIGQPMKNKPKVQKQKADDYALSPYTQVQPVELTVLDQRVVEVVFITHYHKFKSRSCNVPLIRPNSFHS
jgi:hypothetical protein